MNEEESNADHFNSGTGCNVIRSILWVYKFFTEVTKKLPEKVRGGSGMFYTKIHLTDYAKTFLPRKNYSIEDFK